MPLTPSELAAHLLVTHARVIMGVAADSGNVKTVLDDIRGMLQVMIRIVNIEENVG